MLSFHNAWIQNVPWLWALHAWFPSTLLVTETEDSFFCACFVFIATSTTECSIKLVLTNCRKKSDRLLTVTTTSGARIWNISPIDACLHRSNYQLKVVGAYEFVAIFNDFRKVVAGVNLHDRKRKSCGGERFDGKPQQHSRILTAREQQHG